MKKPDFPTDELLRLQTLQNLKILDTDPEERFDRVTRLAKRLFGTKIALVSLVDEDRQWFKSCQGLDASETPRDISFCGHAILGKDVLVVNDTHIDERFSDNPLVTHDPNIRFYAGYPLSAPDGQKVGTLCIIDDVVHEMSEDDVKLLSELGEMIEDEFAVASIVSCDPVTGLANRAGFVDTASHLIALCERNHLPVTLMKFELPNIGLIRNALGDDGVARAVTELAQLLQVNLRGSDVVGRIDEDTFVVLLTGTDNENVLVAKNRILQLLDQRNSSAEATFELEVNAHSLLYDTEKHGSAHAVIEAIMQGDIQDAEVSGQWKLAQFG